MKIPEKTKDKKEKVKKKQKVKPKKEQVLIVAQEFKFARLLSGNEKKTRDKVLKTLKKWLLNCFEKEYEFKEDDFVRVWKGLFYAVWMSDKPLIQEELCENISSVLDLFPAEQLRHALLMYKAGLRVLAGEWYGIDHHRMDKFLMLVRRYLRASLRCLLRNKWSLKSCQMYAKTLSASDGIFALKTPHYARNAASMILHITDCYLEEIAKVSDGSIPEASVVELLRPLCSYMCGGESPQLCAASRRVLTALLRQSELGLKYRHATAAWQKMGCPEGGPEALELVSDDDDDEGLENGDNSDEEDQEESNNERPLDPRAGRVNVELACVPVPAAMLAQLLRDLLATASSKAHKRVKICLQRFEQLARDEYPLRVQTHDPEELQPAVKPRQAAHTLHALEKTLVAQSDELALRGLSRKHRKRLLAKTRSGISIVDEVETVRQKLSTNTTNGDWQVEAAEPQTKETKKDTSNKENKKRKNNAKDATDRKKRKVDAKMNGDATHKQKNKLADKLDNNVNNKNKNIANDHVRNKTTVSNKCEEVKVKKLTENGIQKDKKLNNNKKENKSDKLLNKNEKKEKNKAAENKTVKIDKSKKSPTLLVNNKVKSFQKQPKKLENSEKNCFETPKKVKFVLKNNSMQGTIDYYKSVRQSPNIPFDGTKKPSKTNLKPSTPSPINPFFKKKLKMKN